MSISENVILICTGTITQNDQLCRTAIGLSLQVEQYIFTVSCLFNVVGEAQFLDVENG